MLAHAYASDADEAKFLQASVFIELAALVVRVVGPSSNSARLVLKGAAPVEEALSDRRFLCCYPGADLNQGLSR